MVLAHPPLYAKDGLYLPFVKLKDVVNVPIIMGGKMGDPQLAQDSIKNGSIDFVGLARPLLTDPEWPNKVMKIEKSKFVHASVVMMAAYNVFSTISQFHVQ